MIPPPAIRESTVPILQLLFSNQLRRLRPAKAEPSEGIPIPEPLGLDPRIWLTYVRFWPRSAGDGHGIQLSATFREAACERMLEGERPEELAAELEVSQRRSSGGRSRR